MQRNQKHRRLKTQSPTFKAYGANWAGNRLVNTEMTSHNPVALPSWLA